MNENPIVKFTIAFNDPDLDSEELEYYAQNLLSQMRELDEVEVADRVFDTHPPIGSKSIGAVLVGFLTAEISRENARQLLGFLRERLRNKPIELEVEANGKKLKIKANGQKELEAALSAAQKFVET